VTGGRVLDGVIALVWSESGRLEQDYEECSTKRKYLYTIWGR
jgi:hypothetical protein